MQALGTVFLKINHSARDFPIPYQLWLSIHQDAGQDATYFHTPNANGTQFPIQLINVKWGVSDLDEIMPEILPGISLRVGVHKGFNPYFEPPGDITCYAIYSPGIGVSLE